MQESIPGKKLQIRIFRSLDQLEGLRGAWSTVQLCPESDLDFVKFIIQSRPEILHPYVLVVYRGDQPVALVAGRIERADFEIKIGYQSLWRAPVRRLAIFYGGFMGQADPEVAEIVIRQLQRSLLEEKAVFLLWSGVQTGTDLYRLLTRVPPLLCRDYLAQRVPHWQMSIPSSLEELLEKRMSKKHRYWAKRLFRQLEKDFPDAVRLEGFSAPEEVEKHFPEFIQVAKKTYQWGLGVGFRDDEEHKLRLHLEASKGWHRGYILSVHGEPVAFWICVVYQGIAYSAFTGYDPQYRKYELGTILFLRMIGELSREKLKLLDFGPGTALYKERFGDFSFEEVTVCVYAATVRGMCFNVLKTTFEGPVQAARVLFRRLGIEQRIKKAWRRFATPSRSRVEASEIQA